MYGFISGITDNSDFTYCPKCGGEVDIFYGDGTAKCKACDYHFGVVECEDEDSEN